MAASDPIGTVKQSPVDKKFYRHLGNDQWEQTTPGVEDQDANAPADAAAASIEDLEENPESFLESAGNWAADTGLDALNGLGQGATLGFGDEIAAGVGSLLSGDSYADELRSNRKQLADSRERSPYAYGGGKVLGNVATQVGGGGALKVGRLLASPLGQGALGAVQGLGESEEGTIRGALKNMAVQGGAGLLGGAAGKYFVAPVLRGLGGNLAKRSAANLATAEAAELTAREAADRSTQGSIGQAYSALPRAQTVLREFDPAAADALMEEPRFADHLARVVENKPEVADAAMDTIEAGHRELADRAAFNAANPASEVVKQRMRDAYRGIGREALDKLGPKAVRKTIETSIPGGPYIVNAWDVGKSALGIGDPLKKALLQDTGARAFKAAGAAAPNVAGTFSQVYREPISQSMLQKDALSEDERSAVEDYLRKSRGGQ